MLFGLFGKKHEKEGERIGEVVHYFPKVKAAVVKLEKGEMSIGDRVRIKGHTTNFEQKVESMQVEHESVEKITKGQEAAIRARKKVRRGDHVFMIK